MFFTLCHGLVFSAIKLDFIRLNILIIVASRVALISRFNDSSTTVVMFL